MGSDEPRGRAAFASRLTARCEGLGRPDGRSARDASIVTDIDGKPTHRSGVLHGRRAGRPLRKQQRARYDRDLPTLEIDLADLGDPVSLFATATTEVRLEIGFGGGEHLSAEAARHPQIGFIGCEPFRNGVAKLLEQIEAGDLGNLRLHAGDAAELLDRLPDACLAQVDLLYPDPWPKRRQRKRRFISDQNLDRLGRVMRPGAELRFATDIDDYAGWGLAHAMRSPPSWRRSSLKSPSCGTSTIASIPASRARAASFSAAQHPARSLSRGM